MHLKARLLCFAAALLTVGSCAHMAVPGGAPGEKRPDVLHCPNGNGNARKNGPVVCIDATSLDANPNNFEVSQGSWIHFYMTDTSQLLDIQFDEPSKIEFKERRGNECWLRVKENAPLGHAKYASINAGTGQRKDPDIMIVP